LGITQRADFSAAKKRAKVEMLHRQHLYFVKGGNVFKIFYGAWRGLEPGERKSVPYVQVAFETRRFLKYFKGSALAVFLCLVLHMDQDGHCFPRYAQIRSETGLSLATISRALDELCELRIEGQRVLLRYRVRDERQCFVGGNHFIVYPSGQQLAEHEARSAPDPDFPVFSKSRILKIGA
jgi:hypothetical protein